MITFLYTPDLEGRKILKTKQEQDLFWVHSHADYLIPDFNEEPCEIWISFMEYLEKQLLPEGETVWDQNGGEVTDIKILDATGLTSCVYEAYDIQVKEEDDPKDYKVMLEGYIAEYEDYHVFFVNKVALEI